MRRLRLREVLCPRGHTANLWNYFCCTILPPLVLWKLDTAFEDHSLLLLQHDLSDFDQSSFCVTLLLPNWKSHYKHHPFQSEREELKKIISFSSI